jgi:putative FmdB family regulatory protein
LPTYQYVCTDCGENIEMVQKFSDAPLTTHDACGGKVRKVFSPVGIVFKGSGFYRTDSRASSKVSSPSPNGSGDDKPDKSEKSDKPAAANGNGSDSSSSTDKSTDKKDKKSESTGSSSGSSATKVA